MYSSILASLRYGTSTLRILIPILGFGPMGGFRVLAQLANSWVDAGHEVAFLVPETSLPPYHIPNAAILYVDSAGVECVYQKSAEIRRKATGFDNARSIRNALYRIEKDFDVIFSDNSIAIFAAMLAGVCKNKVYYYNQSDEVITQNFFRVPFKHIIARTALIWSRNIISNSPNYPKKGVEIIYPGVDCEIFHNNRNNPLISKNIVLGTVGRKEPYKGTKYVLDAAKILHESGLNFKLRVALGNLPDDTNESYIEIVDIENDYDLSEFYRSLDILLVGCIGQHGAPHYPLIEGMACGTPVVHTGYYPGTSENSWIATPSDAQSLADTVDKLSRDEMKFKKIDLANIFVKESLSWNKIAGRFLNIFSGT